MNPFLAIPIAYLLGSIPSAVWAGRLFKGIDIRDYGSKNAGLTNVFRVLGWRPALPVVVLDLGKGFLGVWLAQCLLGDSGAYPWLPVTCGMLVVLGHSWTCFAGFRGGKGVLTALGVLLALQPMLAGLAFAVWVALVALSKYVSVGSIGACLALGLFATLGYCKPDFVLPGAVDVYTLALSWVIAVFVIYKHKANMVRLWNGTENGFGKKRRA